jgi:hypothetical protein
MSLTYVLWRFRSLASAMTFGRVLRINGAIGEAGDDESRLRTTAIEIVQLLIKAGGDINAFSDHSFGR